jgi:hypothetical protein
MALRTATASARTVSQAPSNCTRDIGALSSAIVAGLASKFSQQRRQGESS